MGAVLSCSGQALAGLKLAIVGPSFREAEYRRELTELGATVLFAPSEQKLRRLAHTCSKADGIIYITTFTGHDAHDHVTAAAKRHGIPLRRLSFSGMARLRQTALDMAGQMASHKHL